MTDVPVQVRHVWDAIPATNCQGLCHESCGSIHASDIERRVLAERGVRIPDFDIMTVFAALVTQPTCPALIDGQCTVYDVRPTICRLWGAVDDMPCPFGCVPDGGRLTAAAGHKLLGRSLAHGQLASRSARRR